MSTPEETSATQQEPTAPVDSDNHSSIEEKLAEAEQRRKDTQSAYTKGQQKIKALEAERDKLLELATKGNQVILTEDEKSELESLKYEDPEAWRTKMNSLETEARGKARANLDELTGEAKKAAEHQFELSRRQQVLEEFNANSDVQVTEELITNEIPPRITKKLEEGKISFEDFLQEVATYANTGKVVGNEKTLDQPNLGKLGGGVTPKDMKPDASLSESYSNDLY